MELQEWSSFFDNIKGGNLDEETIHFYYKGTTIKVPRSNGYVYPRKISDLDANLNDLHDGFIDHDAFIVPHGDESNFKVFSQMKVKLMKVTNILK